MPTSVIVGIGSVIVLSLIITIVGTMLSKRKVQKYLAEHPDAAKVRLGKKADGLMMQVSIMVDRVDGKSAVVGGEGLTQVLFLPPGRHELSLQVSYVKNVKSNRVSDLTSYWVDIKPNAEYNMTASYHGDDKFSFDIIKT